MAQSQEVNANNAALASQYNNLRKDVLDPTLGHEHLGTADTGKQVIPAGLIAMFAGACPTGWTRYTALDGKFPKGAPTGVTSPLNTGGATTHTHTYAGVIAHTHTAGTLAADSAGAHSHGVQRPPNTNYSEVPIFPTLGQNINLVYDIPTNTAGAHTHTVSGSTASTGVTTDTTASTDGQPPYQEVVFCQKA